MRSRAYVVWRRSEECHLRTLLWQGISPRQIARYLDRSEGAVRARMRQLWHRDEADGWPSEKRTCRWPCELAAVC